MKNANEMSDKEIKKAARNYDNVMNEGGDGYNPYREEIGRRAHEADCKAAEEYAKTPQGQIDALYRRIELECGSVAREWGNADEIDALQRSLYAEIDKIKTEIEAEFLKIWDINTTKSRRIEWNAFANETLIPLSKAGKSPDINRAIFAKQRELGWTMDDLKKAVKTYNL